jgi:hypothetical protein
VTSRTTSVKATDKEPHDLAHSDDRTIFSHMKHSKHFTFDEGMDYVIASSDTSKVVG